MNGHTGLKVTFGRVPKAGVVPLGYSLDQMRELLDLINLVNANPRDPELDARFESVRQEALERRDRLRIQLAAAEEFVAQLHARSTKV